MSMVTFSTAFLLNLKAFASAAVFRVYYRLLKPFLAKVILGRNFTDQPTFQPAKALIQCVVYTWIKFSRNITQCHLSN